ncbi:hypothetical protein OG301_26705 [Streptomyces platensis]|uniref:hypothetical protein n=1 Tax=Streptomyces platensis TaxID=58346 RepID=UPI002ED0753D|nr:hypothetical protein OG301_26705 [Streptomyces platensis]
MTDPELGTVNIGAREIYDQLVAMREEVRSSTQSHAAVAEKLTDHEDRLRAVERWKYSVPTALVTAVISAAVTLATKLGA